MKYVLSIPSILILLLSSCTKEQVEHPFAGDYACNVTHSYTDMTGANSSSIDQETIDVILSQDSIEVFGVKLHEDDVEYGQPFFYGSSYNYMSFHFENDSIYMSSFSGGLGGGSTTTYAGRKIN